MNTTRSVLFALLSLGFLAGCGDDETEDINRLHEEAADLYVKGKYREAKASMTRGYAAFERLEVKDKAKRVEYLRVLSNISNKLQENDKTIEYATEVAIHALTDDDRSFAYGLLGLAYLSKGEYEKAIGYYEKALAISLKALGAEHPDVATTCNNIGTAYQHKGEYDKAIGYYEKSLAIYIKKLGAEHPEVGTTYNNIGLAYDSKGEYEKAIGYYGKSLEIRLKTLGAEHPDVGRSYNNLGGAYHGKGDKATAMAYLLKAKAIFLKKLGAQHPNTKNVQLGIDSLK
jgi:tetratricopeptide (TPR) repeat protein